VDGLTWAGVGVCECVCGGWVDVCVVCVCVCVCARARARLILCGCSQHGGRELYAGWEWACIFSGGWGWGGKENKKKGLVSAWGRNLFNL
jgi:hypothetical protein